MPPQLLISSVLTQMQGSVPAALQVLLFLGPRLHSEARGGTFPGSMGSTRVFLGQGAGREGRPLEPRTESQLWTAGP